MSLKRAFTWTLDYDETFRRVKTALLQPPVLAHFDPALLVVLQTDTSCLYGLRPSLRPWPGTDTSGSVRLTLP